MRRIKKAVLVGIVLLAAVVGLSIVGLCVFLDRIVERGIETIGPKATKVEVRLEAARLSPFSGAGTLKGLFLGNPSPFKTPSAMRVAEASVKLDPRSVLSEKLVIESVNVAGPEITFEGSLKGSNLSQIMENVDAFLAAEQSGADTGAPARKLQVRQFSLTGGKVNLSMTILGGKAVSVPLPDVHLQDLGAGPEGITPAELTAKVFRATLDSVTKAVTHAVAQLGKGALDAAETTGKSAADAAANVGKEAVKGIEQATKSVGDLFKKKR